MAKSMKLWTKTRTLPKPIGRWMCNRYVQYIPDKENIHLFVNGKDSKWTLIDTSMPAHIHTTDGMVQQDGTFWMYLDFLEDWESKEAFIITTDGSSGDKSMSFGWKIYDCEEKML
eukprot:568596-Ditylum_brightwellii.AAC.1